MRKTWALVVFYFYLTGAAVLIEVTGVAAAWGVKSPVGITSAASDIQTEISNIGGSGISALFETLVAIFVSVTSTVEILARGAFALPLFFEAMGVPDPFVAFIFAPLGVIVARDLLHALSGRFA
jgi:hypothetical protein